MAGMQHTFSLRTLLVLLVTLLSVPAVALDGPGGGRGPPKSINPTGESMSVEEAPGWAHHEGRLKGYRVVEWKGRCEVPACKGLYLGPATLAQFNDLVFIREEPRPNGVKAIRYVSRGGKTLFMVIEEAGGKKARVLQYFHLHELWSDVVLEVASGRKGAGGWKFEKNPAALQPVIDEYLKQLHLFTRDHGQKIYETVRWLEYRVDESIHFGVHSRPNASLLVEAIEWFGAGALPLLEEAFADTRLGEFEKAPAIAMICSPEGLKNSPERETLQSFMRGRVKPEMGGFASAAVLGCFEKMADEKVIKPFLLKVLEALCSEPPTIFAAVPELQAWALRLKIHDELEPRMNRCQKEERRDMVKACLRAREATREQLERTFEKGGPEVDEALLHCLQPDEPRHRGAVAGSLGNEHVGRERALEFLARAKAAPASKELLAVARAYSKPPPLEGHDYYVWRARALAYFSRVKREETVTSDARRHLSDALEQEVRPPSGALAQLGSAVKKVKKLGIESEAPSLRIALAVLGEATHERSAATVLRKTDITEPAKVENYRDLVAYGLHLCGCTEELLRTVITKPDKTSDAPLCARH